jgi:hypothetical protein
MESLGVYDYMKWTLLFLSLCVISFSQDSLKKDSLLFEYRFKISSVLTQTDAQNISSELYEIFKSKPVYYKDISQYVFNSNVEISRLEFEAILRRREMELEYYRKTALIPNNGTK